jgi:hypothetical protein
MTWEYFFFWRHKYIYIFHQILVGHKMVSVLMLQNSHGWWGMTRWEPLLTTYCYISSPDISGVYHWVSNTYCQQRLSISMQAEWLGDWNRIRSALEAHVDKVSPWVCFLLPQDNDSNILYIHCIDPFHDHWWSLWTCRHASICGTLCAFIFLCHIILCIT